MKEYTRSINLPPVRLNHESLQELYSLVTKDIKNPTVRIFAYLDTISIREDSLKKFLSHTELPDMLDYLGIEVSEYAKDYSTNKSVTVSFRRYGSDVSSRGIDEAWVNGKARQVSDFVQKRSPRLAFLHSNKVTSLIVFLLAITSLGVAYNKIGIPFIAHNETLRIYLAVALYGIYIIFILFTTAITISPRLYPYTKIKLKEEKGADANVKIGLAQLIIGSVALIISIAAFIVQLRR